MDRLTTLIERFQLRVRGGDCVEPNLLALADDMGRPCCMMFYPGGDRPSAACNPILSARVEWAGRHNPLMAAFPSEVYFDLTGAPETRALVDVMRGEDAAGRCGAQSVVSRLGEVLMVRLLRDQIEKGAAGPGLLAGLSDPRLSRAIVAIHDHPGRNWNNAGLAQEAGLSLSRFSELFAAQVGETPMGYLRRWRLILARQDLLRGERVDTVARRYAYGSPEGFTRAFRRVYGEAPLSLRRAAAG